MKIAIIDSGIHPGHPHVGEIAGAVEITLDGEGPDGVDRLGHGTAVAGAIREKAPDAELYAVKVFDRRLTANIDVILRALEWCRVHEMDIVNLSLGTENPAHRDRFLEALSDDLLVVSAGSSMPGSLPGIIGVLPDPDCPRDVFRYHDGMFHASPYPRPIPGVPVDRNLQGISFAVGNMTGLIAGVLKASSRSAIREALIAQAENTVLKGGA
ncbi:MAG TPA: S8 family serine peptidase [Bryobacteraceae bacterium]|nr:S8 family serine peptidase [Bryobacteraceae bacterium]